MATSRKSTAVRKAAVRGRIKPEGQWHHGDLRESLIAWGTHLLDTEGVSGFSLRAAARLAGVSQGAPAHHFKDKNGLLAAIATQAFRDMLSSRLKRLAAEDPRNHAARLRAVILGYVEFAQAHPARFHLMFSPLIEHRNQYPELLQAGGASFQLLRDAVTAVLPGSRMDKLSEEDLALAVWATTHGLATLTVQGRKLPISSTQRPTTTHFSDVVVRFCLSALS